MPYELLLADDSTTIQRAVEITFTKEPQFSLTTLGANQDIAARAVDIQPAVVLLAATRQPGNDAYSICRSIRQHPRTAHTRIIMLAPEGGDFDPAQATRSGADSYIAKPFDTQTLIDQVKKVVGEPLSASATTARPLQQLRQPAPSNFAPAPPVVLSPPPPALHETLAPPPPVVTRSYETLAPPPPVVATQREAIPPAPPAAATPYETLAPPPPVAATPYETHAPPPPVAATPYETLAPPPPVAATPYETLAPPPPMETPPPVATSQAREPVVPTLESLIANAMDKPTSSAPRTVTAPRAQAPDAAGPSLDDLVAKAIGTPAATTRPSSRNRPSGTNQRPEPVSATSALKNLVANAMPNRAADASTASEIDLFKRYQTAPDLAAPRTQAAKPTTPDGPLPTEPVTESAIESAVRKITQETIERIVWEVVPELAEVMIRERLDKLEK